MHEQQKQLMQLQQDISTSMEQLEIAKKQIELADLNKQMQAPDFWSDNAMAQRVSKSVAKLEALVSPWSTLAQDVAELVELTELNDESMLSELAVQFETLSKRYEEFKKELRFNGKFDDHDAYISIHAGAGGTDAQDWAQMLLRMYLRWAESNGLKTERIDQSDGEEAGIKSVTVSVSGVHAYGRLKGEHGVHRLVRLSPFNADSLRQTSFTKVEIMPVIEQPEEVQIDDKDLKIDVYRAGGHGGQSVNTTDSAVRVTHLPTGITVAIQNERSQLQNKETAMKILRSRIAQMAIEQHQEHLEQVKGPNQSAEWGNQIRSYVLHPYKQVKDLRTRYETSDVDGVLDGKLDALIDAYLEANLAST
jgi:peptide chain release factor 2